MLKYLLNFYLGTLKSYFLDIEMFLNFVLG